MNLFAFLGLSMVAAEWQQYTNCQDVPIPGSWQIGRRTVLSYGNTNPLVVDVMPDFTEE